MQPYHTKSINNKGITMGFYDYKVLKIPESMVECVNLTQEEAKVLYKLLYKLLEK